MSSVDLTSLSLNELFQIEASTHTQTLTDGLLALERDPRAPDQLEACMRAAHSLKGAARIIDLGAGVSLAHAMEECFVAAQTNRITLGPDQIDVLLRSVDLLVSLSHSGVSDLSEAFIARAAEVDRAVDELQAMLAAPVPARTAPAEKITGIVLSETGAKALASEPATATAASPEGAPKAGISPQRQPALTSPPTAQPASNEHEAAEGTVRVSVENLNRLLSLAGESLVESRRLKPFAGTLLRLKRMHRDTSVAFDRMRTFLASPNTGDPVASSAEDARRRLLDCHQFLGQCLEEIEAFDRRATNLAHRLYGQVIACRMRPFADATGAFPRMLRDLGRALGKIVRLEMRGASTPVDRDILERLEAPLGHLLRNAVDHGLEDPAARTAAGKREAGTITLEASHVGGFLLVIVADDGAGVDLDRLRAAVTAGGFATPETAMHLSDSELLEFLFLPGFTMKAEVTEVSGRGVGLDVVRDVVRRVGGAVRMSSELGKGTRFQLQLPLTLSVVRALLVDIGGEPYAFPFAHILRVVKVQRDEIRTLEGRQHFPFEGREVGLIAATQLVGGGSAVTGDTLCVVLIGDPAGPFGLVVDRFLGGRELVVQPLDPRLGKIMDISAGALMEDGSPVLIADVEDMIASMQKLSAQRLEEIGAKAGTADAKRKRVLVVDDSLTVRELERKLLVHHGYDIQVAVDGMDGWNAARAGNFDLVITDVDMPRMDGIELVTQIRRHPHLKDLPVMIVSYKDREEDRERGLEAGADYYLTKASFNDDALIRAVIDLIGEPQV